MISITRYKHNPILAPDKHNPWEATAAFNGCVIKNNNKYHMLYRAISSTQNMHGMDIKLNTIGYADSPDGKQFDNRKQLITPEYDWEQFGCEDPRVTKLDGKYYIFYTAISTWPPYPSGIKVAVAISPDLQTIQEKHLITPFNAKATALFPERINGKLTILLTADTDMPPAKIAIAMFDEEKQMWDQRYWQTWYENISQHVIPLQRSLKDQIEVGAPPVKTEKGWLLIYCNIKNYFDPPRTLGIEAVLLDLDNPLKVLGKTTEPLLVPEEYYEKYGDVPDIVFPSGAIIEDNQLSIYYGAADTTSCLATVPLDDLLKHMETEQQSFIIPSIRESFIRFEGNPILMPDGKHEWEDKAAFNTAAVAVNDKIYLVYRAQNTNNVSTLGYASTGDGLHLTERLEKPIYQGKEIFEINKFGPSGCEDPRITLIGDKLYMFYTAYNGLTPRVAVTSIAVNDFVNQKWLWEKPKVITDPLVPDKDACVFPEKINGKWYIFHRLEPSVWLDTVDDLEFTKEKWLEGQELFSPRLGFWDDGKVGIGAPPVKTEYGWLLIYHAITRRDNKYRLGAALLDLNNPANIIARLDEPIFEPDAPYENHGLRSGTVFTNGIAIKDDMLYLYYGAADQFTAVARTHFPTFLEMVKNEIK